ncbi:DEKNAAC102058 [Brettanomyces naardenensis]|uniref:diphosphoinositol-polyphosphate diphosphatase n=1 Tax=Brettanomyces naardenensis TaxID=13370 RepID=A0A448YJM4_BRENA|nr:DEKNAAC102058 [Brettanomyces naardenensis]
MEDDIFDFEPSYEAEGGGEEKEHDEKILTDNHAVKLVDQDAGSYITQLVKDEGEEVTVEDGGDEDEDDDDKAEVDEEDLYDKFVPTDPAKVKEYKRSYEKRHKLEEYIITEPKNSQDEETRIRIDRPVGVYTPPENFALVCSTIYRSSFPRVENFEFLETLRLKAVICLIPEEYPPENREFDERNGIKFFQVGLSGNKEPFVKIKPELVTEALKIIADPANQPILIHCNRGKHRTGCVVGCIRKLQRWSLSMIFDEYRKFAYPKERPLDQQFIEMYDGGEIEEYEEKRGWETLRWSEQRA